MSQLPLPMTPAQCLQHVVVPALALLGAERYDSPEARVLMLAISGQESGLAHRQQVKGPARGLWQFEQGGGVRGVLNHPSTRVAAVPIHVPTRQTRLQAKACERIRMVKPSWRKG